MKTILRLLSLGLAGMALTAAGAKPAPPAPAPPPRAAPHIRAVLVGVAQYDNPAFGELEGARNDVLLMARTLVTERHASPADITVLVDAPEKSYLNADVQAQGIKIAGSPTRAAIDQALQQLAAQTRPGDEVVVQLSGHGMQQIEMVKGNEADGLDEAFMPRDSGEPPHDESHARIANALIDDRIGELLTAIRDKGGNVFFIADFCHSGDSDRGGGADTSPAIRRDSPLDAMPEHPGQGALVAFFAAQSDLLAAQRVVPYWANADKRHIHSVLSYYTAVALADPSLNSYGDIYTRLDGYILQSNRVMGLEPASITQPMGPLDRPLFGTGSGTKGRRAWPYRKPGSQTAPYAMEPITIPAGEVAGIVRGARFTISRYRPDGQSETILYGEAGQVTPFSTQIIPASSATIAAAAWADLKISDGGQPPRSYTEGAMLEVRLENQPVGGSLPVFLPEAATALSPEQKQALHALQQIHLDAIGAKAASTRDTARLALVFRGNQIDFIVPGKPADHSYGRIDLTKIDAPWLREKLEDAIGRAVRYDHIGTTLGDTAAQPEAEDAPTRDIKTDF